MGRLALRTEWDHALLRSASDAGVVIRQACVFLGLERKKRRVLLRTNRGRLETRFVVAADGVNSRVRRKAGLHEGWSARHACICANADVPADRKWIEDHFGPRPAIHLFPAFENTSGYAWIFPKRDHVCVGIGFRPAAGQDVRKRMRAIVDRALRLGLLPRPAEPDEIDYALDPTGLAPRLARLADDRVVLAGDAGGFVSPSTGEGIFPGMVSGRIAASVIDHALRHARSIDTEAHASRCRYEFHAWFRPVGNSRVTHQGLDTLFRWPLAARIAARMYAYGEKPNLATLMRSLVER